MADFGFDAYIPMNLLAANSKMRDEHDRTLAEVAQARAATQSALWQQQRQRTLADLVSRTAQQNPNMYSDPAAQSYAQGGFGQEANDRQQQAIQLGQQIFAIHRNLTASQLTAADTPDKVEKVLDGMRSDPMLSRYYSPPAKDAADEEKMGFKDNFIKAQLSPEQQAENQTKTAANRELKENPATGQMMVFDKNDKSVTPVGGGGIVSGALEPAALDSAANAFHRTGKMPEGTDPAGIVHKQIQNRAAQLFPNDNIAANAANYDADKASLESYQKGADATSGFLKTFERNSKTLREAVAELPSSQYPLLNKLMRNSQTNVSGDPRLTRVKVALNAVNSEAAKINSGSLSGSPPLATLEEMSNTLPEFSTKEQFEAGLNAYGKDTENRAAAMREQLGAVKGRLAGPKPGGASSLAGGERRTQKAKPAAARDATAHPQATDAVTWARAHQGDPRATEILRRLGQ